MREKSIGSYEEIIRNLPPRLHLSTYKDSIKKLHEIIDLLGIRYGGIRYTGIKELDPFNLYATQPFLESDKLGLVLYLVLFKEYDVPVIVAYNSRGEYYILDGHHRARVYVWLRKKLPAHLIYVPAYRPRISNPLCVTDVINPPSGTPDEILPLRHMVNTIVFLEKMHGIIARIWREEPLVKILKPTQPPSPILGTQDGIYSLLPILVYDYLGSKYVVDGHKRTCKAILQGIDKIKAITFTLHTYIGLIRVGECIGYDSFDEKYCRAEER